MMIHRTGRLRSAALVTAVLALAPALLVAAPAAAEAGATACETIDFLLGNRAGAGLLTPGKTAAAQKAVPPSAGLAVAVHTTEQATWELRDQSTGDVWLSGTSGMDETSVVFTQPSPFTRVCLEITNQAELPLTFVYVLERLS